MAASTDELVDIILDVDLNKEPACEGSEHPAGTEGHDGGPARWLLVSPCGCPPFLLCHGRALVHRMMPLALCGACGSFFPSSDIKFIEL